MKILRFDRNIEDTLPPLTELPGGGLPVGLIADSAINRNRHPVFIPDFASEGWILEILPAIQISRLGKFIAPRFASRYIGALTLCALLRPQAVDTATSLSQTPLSVPCKGRLLPSPSPASLFFDCALTIGDLQPFNKKESLTISAQSAPIKGSEGEIITCESTLAAAALQADELIARASIYCTLKSGDLLLPGSLGLTLPATLNHSLTATINGAETLSTRLK